MNYLKTLVPAVVTSGTAAGLAFFATWSQSDAKTAAIAAGAAFFGAFGAHTGSAAVGTAKAQSTPGS